MLHVKKSFVVYFIDRMILQTLKNLYASLKMYYNIFSVHYEVCRIFHHLQRYINEYELRPAVPSLRVMEHSRFARKIYLFHLFKNV